MTARSHNIQLDENGRLKHFLTTEGLDRKLLVDILDHAESFDGVGSRAVKKVPLLRGKTIVNLFFEPSTRTSTTFELAAKRLSADILSLNLSTSSTSKGESLLDTLRTLEAMHSDMFIVRHSSSGAAHFIARHVAPHISVINGGDGQHAHPTQAMLDMYTIRKHKPDFETLCVAIVGDILHSRVARSDIHALKGLGVNDVRVVGPKTLIPAEIESLGVSVFDNLRTGLKDADVVIMLRLQRERMISASLPSETEYFSRYGLTEEKLSVAKDDAIVMHPGPINRGIEIDSGIADGERSVILQQVSHGIAVRMAVMAMTMGSLPGRPGGVMKIRIDNGRLIDPAAGLDAPGSVCVAGGSIVAAGAAPGDFHPDSVIDAAGRWVCPGIIDLSVRFAGSGAGFRSGLAGETAAAAAAGVTSVCCPPDTSPVMDTPAVVELIRHAGAGAGYARVYPIGALTLGLGGERLAEMHALKLAGCVAVGNANEPMLNNEILRRALEYAASTDLTVFLHAEDHHLGNRGVVNEGAISTRLGLPPVPATAETVAVAAALLLIEHTGARAHFCRLSTARAVEMVGRAKQYGLPVTADAGICHLYLTEQDVDGYDANCHLIPPLRRPEDRAALVQGLADGVIDAVCSDHQPLGNDAKLAPFNLCRPGASTVEALLPLMLDLLHKGVFTPLQALEKLTVNPGRILGLKPGLSPGQVADIIIVDPDVPWALQAHQLRSAGKNTPFDGWELQGRVTHTLLGGRLVHAEGKLVPQGG